MSKIVRFPIVFRLTEHEYARIKSLVYDKKLELEEEREKLLEKIAKNPRYEHRGLLPEIEADIKQLGELYDKLKKMFEEQTRAR